jgi:NitT/TauT family transport system substrate-binding protein
VPAKPPHPLGIELKRSTCRAIATLLISVVALVFPGFIYAQDNVKFLNDWRWEGPAAPLLMAVQTTFPKAKLNVTITPGTGSGATVGNVASGEFDIGLGDFSALVEHAAKNANVPPPVAVYVLYERTPATLFIRRASGASSPAHLEGKKLGAPPFDGGRKLWPAFASLANTGKVQWQNLDATQRETVFAAGQIDGITGFYFTTILNLEAKGVSGRDYTVHPFYEHGLRMYGNVIIVNPAYLKANPKVVERFVRAYHAAVKSALKDTDAAVKFVKAADDKADERMEWRRARLAFEQFVLTPTVMEQGLGTIDMDRVERSIRLLAEAYKLPVIPAANTIATVDFLPPAADRKM